MMETDNLKRIGRSLVTSGRHGDALAIFEKALQRDPEDVQTLDMLGFLYYGAGSFERARSCCERSIELAPTNHYAHKGLGLCLVKLGQPEEGIAALKRSIELEPGYFDSRHDLAVTLLELGRLDEARDCFEAARRVDPTRSFAVDRGLARMRKLLRGRGLEGV